MTRPALRATLPIPHSPVTWRQRATITPPWLTTTTSLPGAPAATRSSAAPARRDLDQRLAAARRAPEPVARRVVVARGAQRGVGLAGQLAVRLLAQVLLDAHRESEPLGQDGGRLARAQERARHDRDRPVVRRDPRRRRAHPGVSGRGMRA